MPPFPYVFSERQLIDSWNDENALCVMIGNNSVGKSGILELWFSNSYIIPSVVFIHSRRPHAHPPICVQAIV